MAGVTDTAGHLAGRYVYDVWGQQQLTVANPGIATQIKFGHTGEALDPGTSLYYRRSRYYDPVLGPFINTDSFLGLERSRQSVNRCTHGRNIPATLTDRTGFFNDDFRVFLPLTPPLPSCIAKVWEDKRVSKTNLSSRSRQHASLHAVFAFPRPCCHRAYG